MSLITLAAANAFADGFVCDLNEDNLRIKVYNKTSPDEGTRSPAVMILSNPQVGLGRKTVATFSTANDSLLTAHDHNLEYRGRVDSCLMGSNRAGEYLVGTRLGAVDTIYLTIDFVYGDNLVTGDTTPGQLVVQKRDGQLIVRDATCTRYLKGE